MRRAILAVTVAGALAAVPATASGDPGGAPNAAGDCGIGASIALHFVQDPTAPGATEAALIPISSVGCTGPP